jgi:hypothetical protein
METEVSTEASALGGNSIQVGHSFRRMVQRVEKGIG